MAQPPDKVHPTIGRYTVLSKLGEGGMAEIFLAELRGTKGFKKRVVIKMLLDEHQGDDHQLSMFADEARVGSRMEYPHIPRVIELGEHAGLPFMVQEYVEGPALTAVLQRQKESGQIDLRVAVRIVADVARALDHAHRVTGDDGKPLHVVHRDVSPSNILVARQGVAKLIDFGVARFEDRETHTEANLLKGKLRYLAPETITDGTVSHRTDVFALGVVLYIATTGRSPWRNAQDLARRMQGTFDRPRDVVPAYPADLESVVMRSLEADPDDRTPDAATLARQLDGWLHRTGGRVSNEQLSSFVEELFPEGPEGWLPRYDLDRSTLSALRLQPPAPVSHRGRAAAAVGTLALVAVAAAGAVASIVLAVALYTRAPEVVVERVDPTEQARHDFAELLRRAEQSHGDDDYEALRRHLRALDRIEVSVPDLLEREQALRDHLELHDELVALQSRVATEPEAVLPRATELLARHPTEPRLPPLIEAAEQAIEAARVAAAPAPNPAAPAPRPAPALEPSLLTVEGSPAGAEVVVDGRFVGTVPLQLVVDPGPHDVALRAEGYVQRRENVDAAGEALSVRIDLPPLKSP